MSRSRNGSIILSLCDIVAIAIELWVRSRHGTWRFFQVTPSLMVEVDRCGNRIESGQTVAYLEGVAKRERDGGVASPS